VNGLHRQLRRRLLQCAADEGAKLAEEGFGYIGTTKPVYFLRVDVVRRLLRGFARQHGDLALEELVGLLDSLALGRTHNERACVGLLLEAYPRLRAQLDPRCLDKWLEDAEGWAEVDVICQSNFSAELVLSRWRAWKSALNALARSGNIHKRRASLVLLNKPLRQSADARLADQAFATIARLAHERHILITKAISWVLRSLTVHHAAAVKDYLDAHAAALPAIAVRETRSKLACGTKTPRRRKARA
jgi:3-methyladenine DNA glycosylase AlkD